MYNNIKEILGFIKDNSKDYLLFLSELGGFPSVCDYSSMILGAYLSERFDIEPIYMEGDYEVNDNFHCWLDIDNIIIDFTACQFKYNEDELEIMEETVKGLNKEELYKKLIIDNKLSIIIEEEDELYDEYNCLGDTSIEKEYLECAKEYSDFKEYLINAKKILNQMAI